MSPDRMLLEVLTCIADISNSTKLGFKEKLNQILLEIVSCMQVKKGSIMLLKAVSYTHLTLPTKRIV